MLLQKCNFKIKTTDETPRDEDISEDELPIVRDIIIKRDGCRDFANEEDNSPSNL